MRLRRPSVRSAVEDAAPTRSTRRPGTGSRPSSLVEQAADRVDVVVLEVEAEQVAELVDGQPRAHAVAPVAEVLDLRGLAVVLVGDVADELLDEVLEGHEPGDAAVLVDDHREVVRLELHLPQQRRRPSSTRARTAPGARARRR